MDKVVKDDMEYVVEEWYGELTVLFEELGFKPLGLRAATSAVQVLERPEWRGWGWIAIDESR